MRHERIAWTAAFALSIASGSARADDEIHGRLELQDAGLFARSDSIEAALGEQDGNDLLGNFRLIWEPTLGSLELRVSLRGSTEYGSMSPLERADAGLLPSPPSAWFDLTNTVDDRGDTLATQTIDRLSVAYTAPDFVIRLGRQALTWGSGLVFRPMDLFDPFSPSATDTEYKPGTDMLYAQWLFGDGSDLQFIVVPRSARLNGAPTADESSIALHFDTTLFDHQTTWLLARDHGDWVGALGVNGALERHDLECRARADIRARGPDARFRAGQYQRCRHVVRSQCDCVREYFHNGFGVAGSDYNLASLPPDLLDRLERGQLFDTRRDYLAGGLTLEVTPLLNVSPTLIADLNDAESLRARVRHLFGERQSQSDRGFRVTFRARAHRIRRPAACGGETQRTSRHRGRFIFSCADISDCLGASHSRAVAFLTRWTRCSVISKKDEANYAPCAPMIATEHTFIAGAPPRLCVMPMLRVLAAGARRPGPGSADTSRKACAGRTRRSDGRSI